MSRQIGAKYRKYPPSKIEEALKLVESGMPTKTAARTMGIPRTTLADKLSGKAPLGSKPGRATVLTKAEEQVLVDYCKLMAEIGYPLKRFELCSEVKRCLDHDGRRTPFNNNLPGKDWFTAFKKRHPDISERTAATLGHQRSLINQEKIENWFSNLRYFLQREVDGWEQLLADPRRLFNADESGFPLCVNSGRVLAEKGARHVYQVSSGTKQQITFMACFNAAGDYCPPLIVYPGQRFRDIGVEEFPEAIYGHSDNGWMDSPLFVAFLEHLDNFVTEKQITRPVLLFVDGHSTHMSLDAAQFCHDHNIILYCLLENATHVLQPCDVGLFGPMKSAWKCQVKHWQMENLGQCFTKKHFPAVFRKAWYGVTKIENAIHGFRRCGLFPMNSKNIDSSKLNPSKVMPNVKSTVSETPSPSSCNIPHSAHAVVDTVNTRTYDTTDASEPQVTITPMTTSVSETHVAKPAVTTSKVTVVTPDSANVLPEATTSLLVKKSTYVTEAIDFKGDARPTAVKIIRTDRECQVSESFGLLKVPEFTAKKTGIRNRQKMSKAISGSEGLKQLKERQLAKEAEEEAKKKRKMERELKKKVKEEEKQRKQLEREEKKEKREELKLLKSLNSRRKRSASSSSSDSDTSLTYVESDGGDDEGDLCPGCHTDDGALTEWIICIKCGIKWHISCTDEDILREIPLEQVKNFPFICEKCQLN